jgi:hypothetical protein
VIWLGRSSIVPVTLILKLRLKLILFLIALLCPALPSRSIPGIILSSFVRAFTNLHKILLLLWPWSFASWTISASVPLKAVVVQASLAIGSATCHAPRHYLEAGNRLLSKPRAKRE